MNFCNTIDFHYDDSDNYYIINNSDNVASVFQQFQQLKLKIQVQNSPQVIKQTGKHEAE